MHNNWSQSDQHMTEAHILNGCSFWNDSETFSSLSLHLPEGQQLKVMNFSTSVLLGWFNIVSAMQNNRQSKILCSVWNYTFWHPQWQIKSYFIRFHCLLCTVLLFLQQYSLLGPCTQCGNLAGEVLKMKLPENHLNKSITTIDLLIEWVPCCTKPATDKIMHNSNMRGHIINQLNYSK